MPTNSTVHDIGCSYERYDINTLEPANNDTYIRLIETGWTRETFEGQSVLDIGCNSGALSLFAHSLGAKSVRSVDITPEFVEFFSAVVKKHKLPITVAKKAFYDLDQKDDSSDVVLCMEVLHWIVHQGGELPEAVAHLASLTNKTLYIETPWDIKEPSIANRKEYPFENYDIELILRSLSQHFQEVQIQRFMTYFGTMKDSKRVLIKASGKRNASLPLQHFRDSNMSGISMSRGVNETELVTTTFGPKALKSLPASSAFVRLDDESVENLGVFLNSAPINGVVVAPERIGGAFRKKCEDGKTYMLFPFVGNLKTYFPKKKKPEPASKPIDLVMRIFPHFSRAPEDVLASLRCEMGRLTPLNFDKLSSKKAKFFLSDDQKSFLVELHEMMADYDASLEDGLLHFDVQSGNMIKDCNGNDCLVDLDLMRSGPMYADILACALYTGTSEKVLISALREVSTDAPRELSKFDIAFAVTSVLNWYKFREVSDLPVDNVTQKRLLSALAVQMKLFRTL